MTNHSHVYSFLERACARPKPFEHGTAKELWTDPHTSESMLRMHLDVQTDAASRNAAFIARSVDWIASRFGVGPGCTVADFGCGPGLYTTALAKKGAQVTGVDFSQRSLRHARETALAEALAIDYVHQDYLRFETDRRFRLITLITCDFCALSPDSRMALLRKFNSLLAPEGRILFDVYSLNALAARKESLAFEPDQLGGFWAPERYFGFQSTFLYEEEKLALDKHTIVERHRIREIYNWFQHFSPESLAQELAQAELAVEAFFGDVAGSPFDEVGLEFAVVARKA